MFRFEITVSEFHFGYYYHHTYVFEKKIGSATKEEVLHMLERNIALIHPESDIIQETITKLM